MDRRTVVTRLAASALAAGGLSTRELRRIGVPDIDRNAADRPSDAEITRWLRLASVPSIAIASVRDGRVSTRVLGVKRAGTTEPVTPDSVYQAASLTKLVTAYVTLGLVLDGAFTLDTPITSVLAVPTPADPRAGTITVRHLLSHSSGWQNWRFGNDDTLSCAFDPGTAWRYSGEGYFFLQRMAEKVTGRGFARLARERVFGPLGMRLTSMSSIPSLESNLVAGHNSRGVARAPYDSAMWQALAKITVARGVEIEDATVEDSVAAIKAAAPNAPALPNNLAPNAAASLRTTANDYGAFLRHLVTARQAGGRAAEIVAHITTPTVTLNDEVKWGLGAGLELVRGTWRSWQWGDNGGYKNYYSFDAAAGTATVVFTNGDAGAPVYQRVLTAMDGSDHPAFLM